MLRPRSVVESGLPSVEALIERSGYRGALSFAAVDLRSGAVVDAAGADTALPPASVAKALTASYALEALGPDHRFVTRVIAGGPIRDGVLRGDLILAGGGDPTLDTDGLAALAAQLPAAGIRRVEGRFLAWGGHLGGQRQIDPSQPAHVGYNPSVSGLNLNYNRVHFEWKRAGNGYATTMEARTARYSPAVRVATMAVADRSMPVYTYDDSAGRDAWTVARGALGGSGSRWLPVRRPERYAGEAFQAVARLHEVVLPEPQVSERAPRGVEVARHASAPLTSILRDMLHWSTNLTAEVVGMEASRARLGRPAAGLRESAEAMNTWGRTTLGLRSMALVDHSGLGDASRITAADMARALRALHGRSGVKPLLKPHAMRDGNGRPQPGHPLAVAAKTGTLNFVSGLAGYVDTPGGGEIVFAIFTADLDRRAGLSRAERERPEGGRAWTARARRLQQLLIERWGALERA